MTNVVNINCLKTVKKISDIHLWWVFLQRSSIIDIYINFYFQYRFLWLEYFFFVCSICKRFCRIWLWETFLCSFNSKSVEIDCFDLNSIVSIWIQFMFLVSDEELVVNCVLALNIIELQVRKSNIFTEHLHRTCDRACIRLIVTHLYVLNVFTH